MLPSRRRLFPGTCLFQQNNDWPHSAQVITAWIPRHKVCVLDWPVCGSDLSPIENVQYGASSRGESDNNDRW